MSRILSAAAVAHPNIALIKYWGKASGAYFNEPAVSSLSITLDTLATETRVSFDPDLASDELYLNGRRDDKKLHRISENLDKVRALAGITTACRIDTQNNFPTGAGLASSASGFAALVAASNRALGLNLTDKQQSMLARSMSGSAARSIYGGFAKISLPDADDHVEGFGSAYAEAIAPAEYWPLEVCVAVIAEQEKDIGSTEGMELSRETSPYYEQWLAGNDRDILQAEAFVKARDFDALAAISEHSCLKMHALAMASQPGLLYWHGATVEGMHCVRALRREGVPVFFTIDAGPQLKAICAPGFGEQVEQALAAVSGVRHVIRCGLGRGVQVSD